MAVRLVVDREEEIRAFKPEEYWSIDAKFIPKGSRKQFPAVFYGTEAEKIKLSSKEEVDKILEAVKDADFQITKLKKGTRRKSPAPPFITSTLQQEASRKLGFQARRTMKAAQEDYRMTGNGGYKVVTFAPSDVQEAAAMVYEAFDIADQYRNPVVIMRMV